MIAKLKFYVRTILAVSGKETALQVQYRNKFLVDLFSHFLGVLPLLLITIGLSGSTVGTAGDSSLTVDRTVFVLLGFIAFLAFGYGTPIMLYSGMGWGISMEVTTGTLERNLLAPVPRQLIVLGIGLYYAVLYAFHVLSLLGIAVILLHGSLALTGNGFGTALAAAGGLLALSIGMGLGSAAVFLLVKDSSMFQIIVHRPFMILSGAVFFIEILPKPLEVLARANPITYGIDAFRSSLSDRTSLIPVASELWIVYGAAAAAFVAGWFCFGLVLRRQMRTGELTAF